MPAFFICRLPIGGSESRMTDSEALLLDFQLAIRNRQLAMTRVQTF